MLCQIWLLRFESIDPGLQESKLTKVITGAEGHTFLLGCIYALLKDLNKTIHSLRVEIAPLHLEEHGQLVYSLEALLSNTSAILDPASFALFHIWIRL